MADVFISYKAEDRRRVKPLVEALQADGLSVWWDEQIGAGDAWRDTIEQQLGGASSRAAGPVARSHVDRRAVLAGGAVAAVAVAGVAGWALFKSSPASAGESIAVLPFENLSGDPNQAYFSDGLAEELRSALSRVAQLKVAARTSSEAVRNDDAKTAAQKLGVANIVTGSVRRSPAIIRVSAQ